MSLLGRDRNDNDPVVPKGEVLRGMVLLLRRPALSVAYGTEVRRRAPR
jgi:hypothetical protein